MRSPLPRAIQYAGHAYGTCGEPCAGHDMSRLLPLLVFAALCGLLGFGIRWNTHHETNEVPSPLVGKTAPEFTLPLLYEPTKSLSRRELLGQAYLLNVFGSWCPTCQDEHPFLMREGK